MEKRPCHTDRPRRTTSSSADSVAAMRRCAICGLRISVNELCWSIMSASALLDMQLGAPRYQDTSMGGSHKECLLWSATICPHLSPQSQPRQTDLRVGSQVLAPRGTSRGAIAFVGTRVVHVAIYPGEEQALRIVLPVPVKSHHPKSLAAVITLYNEALLGTARSTDTEDEALLVKLTSEDHDYFIRQTISLIDDMRSGNTTRFVDPPIIIPTL
jgi:hypothetical protein